MVVKTTVLISRFQRKNRFVKRPYIAWDINQKLFSTNGLDRLAKSQNNFEDILGQVSSFFKPFFTLKSWDQDCRFKYHESHKQTDFFLQNLAVFLKNGLKKSNLQENLTWSGQTGIQLGMWEP